MLGMLIRIGPVVLGLLSREGEGAESFFNFIVGTLLFSLIGMVIRSAAAGSKDADEP